MNITYYPETDEIYIFTDPGRTRRPLIVVEGGESKLKQEHIQKLEDGELDWNDLIDNGIIEYIDAEEEENAYIAMKVRWVLRQVDSFTPATRRDLTHWNFSSMEKPRYQTTSWQVQV